jgi:predicted DNA-binding ribbon-helix-helix protein
VERSRVVKRSVVIGQHKTSVSLELEFFKELKRIAQQRQISLTRLVSEIDDLRIAGNLSSALRVYVLEWMQNESRSH